MRMNVIDIHCHIIPEVDDGAEDIEVSVHMAKNLADAGINTIIATPHMYTANDYSVKFHTINKQFNLLKERIKEEKIPINLKLGYEVQTRDSITTQDIIGNLVIEDTEYVLIEPVFGQDILLIDEVIYNLSVWGLKSILAHVERIDVLMNRFDVIESWVDDGVIIQMNLLSLLGKYGRIPARFVKKLLKRGLIHIVGSDAHDIQDTEHIGEALYILRRIVNEEYYTELVNNNALNILKNDQIHNQEIIK